MIPSSPQEVHSSSRSVRVVLGRGVGTADLQAHASSIASTFVLGGISAVPASVSDDIAAAVGVASSELG